MAKENHIILKVEAIIARREPTKLNPYPISLSINGRAYPRISSGSYFGFGGSYNDVKEAKNALEKYLENEIEWFEKSYFRPVKVKLTVKNEFEDEDCSVRDVGTK